jgi:hypothetical protein
MASLILSGSTSGSVTLSSPAVSGTTTLTLPTTSGTVLTSANIGSNLPAGSVLQVVSTTKTDTFTTASTNTYVDVTGLSVSITPSNTSNKVLIIVSINQAASGEPTGFQIVRDSTAIGIGTASGSRFVASAAGAAADGNRVALLSMNYLDSPSTTSSTTYKIQVRGYNNGVSVNRTPNDTDASISARTVSSITVMEIKG